VKDGEIHAPSVTTAGLRVRLLSVKREDKTIPAMRSQLNRETRSVAANIATDTKLRTTINSNAYAVEGIYCRLVLTALATAIV
jgi:hypothetical protein